MFSASGNKGFSITFENGNTVSVQWGPGNYCNPTHELGRGAAYNAPAEADRWESATAEVAAWNSQGEWHNCGGDQVKGWLKPDEVAAFIEFVANNKLDTSSPFSLDDDDDTADDDDVVVMSEDAATTRELFLALSLLGSLGE